MNKEEMVNFLIDCIGKAYKTSTDGLTADTDIAAQFGTKSLPRVALCALIENETDVTISLGDIGKYKTIGDLADMVLAECEDD